MAATLDTRVVLGERDIPTTISRCVRICYMGMCVHELTGGARGRAGQDGAGAASVHDYFLPLHPTHNTTRTTQTSAWDCLSPGDKAGIVLEFLVLALLPPALARRVLRLPPSALIFVRRASDAGAEVRVRAGAALLIPRP